jgi:hypothetical protein
VTKVKIAKKHNNLFTVCSKKAKKQQQQKKRFTVSRRLKKTLMGIFATILCHVKAAIVRDVIVRNSFPWSIYQSPSLLSVCISLLGPREAYGYSYHCRVKLT